MTTSTPQSDAFPAAYNAALHAARDLTLAPDERAPSLVISRSTKVAQMLPPAREGL